MNGVLEFPSVKAQESDTEVLKQFANQTVKENKAAVIRMINTLNEPDYIIETITFKILSLILSDKSKEDILEYIVGGTCYKLSQLLIEGFLDDPDIKSSMPKHA